MLVTIITGQGSGEEAVQAMDDGIFDYIPKPCKVSEIRESFRRGVPEIGASEMEDDGVPLGGGDPTAKELVVIARSRAMIHMLRQAHKIAKMNRPVLVQGETGTGKEVVARKIHAMSSRGDKKFIPVNCGAIPQELIESELFGHIKGSFTGADKDRTGLFEEASGGTIFLDEVTETSPAFQVKLLRVLQEGKLRRVGSNQEVRVDVRVIAACNKNVLDEVAQNRFRQDLYFRLTGSEIYLPPLKERREDIIPLAEHFAAKTAGTLDTQVILSKSVKKVLQGFDWPGNVRQLENAVDYAVQSCNGTVLLSDLPRNLQVTVGDVEEDEKTVIGTAEEVLPLAEVERRYIAQVMRMCGGNKTKAAKLLGVSRRSFYNKTSGADTVDGEIEAAADQ
jgi:DNA-binding NtrC family response regulator